MVEAHMKHSHRCVRRKHDDPHLVRQVQRHPGQRSVVGESLLSVDPRCEQSCHHGHSEATQPGLGLLLEPQCSRFDSHLDVVVLILVIKDGVTGANSQSTNGSYYSTLTYVTKLQSSDCIY